MPSRKLSRLPTSSPRCGRSSILLSKAFPLRRELSFSRREKEAPQFAEGMNGKRGEKPPLPRNCKRLLRSAISHCPIGWEGAGQQMCVASQETGPSAYLWSALPRAKEDVIDRKS